MIKSKFVGCALLAVALVAFLVAGVSAEQTKQAPKASKAAKSRGKESPPAVKMGLEPKAIELPKAACDRLAAARTMKFTAVVSYESPSRLLHITRRTIRPRRSITTGLDVITAGGWSTAGAAAAGAAVGMVTGAAIGGSMTEMLNVIPTRKVSIS